MHTKIKEYTDNELKLSLKDKNMTYEKYEAIKQELEHRKNIDLENSEPNNLELDNYIYNDITNPSNKSNSTFNFQQFIIILIITGVLIITKTYSLNFIIILSASIFIHEIGHAIAMKLLDYKDVKIFVIPFLGGLTSGKQSVFNELYSVLVSLSGPIFGLLMGSISFILFNTFHFKILYTFATISIILNAFNLLPIVPLDGGQIFQKLIPSKFIKTIFFIQIASIIALFYMSYIFNSTLLIFIALLSAVNIKGKYKQLKILDKLKTEIKIKKFSTKSVSAIRQKLELYYTFKNDITYKATTIKSFTIELLETPINLFPRISITIFYFLILLGSIFFIKTYI